MNKKIIKLILTTIILALLLTGCGYVTIDGGYREAEYNISNKLGNKNIYYETEYYDIQESKECKKEGEIKSNESLKIGSISVEKDGIAYLIYDVKIYEDETKQKLIYSYDGTTENRLKDFKYIEEENSMIFEITEDKINK